MEIINTRDYSKFVANRYQSEERTVSNGERLAKLYVKEGYRLEPAKVMQDENGKLLLIDGHSRLYACKKTGEKFNYFIDTDAVEEDIFSCNYSQSRWTAILFAKAYVADGIEEYATYLELKNTEKFKHGTVLALLTNKGDIKSFNSARLKIVNSMSRIKHNTSFIRKMIDTGLTGLGYVAIHRAVNLALISGLYEEDILFRVLIERRDLFPDASSNDSTYTGRIAQAYREYKK